MTSIETRSSWSDRVNPRNWTLTWKLVVIGLVPALLALALGVLRVSEQASVAAQLGRENALSELRDRVAAEADGLRTERSLVAAYLGGGRRGDTQPLREMIAHQEAEAARMMQLIQDDSTVSDVVRATYQHAAPFFAGLGQLRQQVLSDAPLSTDAAIAQYTRVIGETDTFSRSLLRQIDDQQVATLTDALTEVTAVDEEMALQHAVGAGAIAAGRLDPASRSLLSASVATLPAALGRFDLSISEQQRRQFGDLGGDATNTERVRLTNALLAAPANGPLNVQATEWDAAFDTARKPVQAATGALRDQVLQRATAAQAEASNQAGINAVVVMLVLLVGAAIVVFVSRSLSRSLRVLRTTALDVAERRLPQAVDDVRSGRAVNVLVDPVPVSGRDEVAQVARAFDAVHRQAVRLASDQAALQTNVSNMFVNLSRRSQALVERQLQLIEQLESNEQDPDQLSNLFQLDHLATRMRRNSENLLVLGGTDLAKRNIAPVPVVDVLRAAVSEIEQYQRIVVQPPPLATIAGRAASDLVHLLAELLDNATNFSPPDSQVVLSTTRTGDGLMIEIADRGVGMADYELDEANQRLAGPSAVDVSVSRRMGLFVVSRLAARHGIDVRLGSSSGGGLTASVAVSSALVPSAEPAERTQVAGVGARQAGPAPAPRQDVESGPGWGGEEPETRGGRADSGRGERPQLPERPEPGRPTDAPATASALGSPPLPAQRPGVNGSAVHPQALSALVVGDDGPMSPAPAFGTPRVSGSGVNGALPTRRPGVSLHQDGPPTGPDDEAEPSARASTDDRSPQDGPQRAGERTEEPPSDPRPEEHAEPEPDTAALPIVTRPAAAVPPASGAPAAGGTAEAATAGSSSAREAGDGEPGDGDDGQAAARAHEIVGAPDGEEASAQVPGAVQDGQERTAGTEDTQKQLARPGPAPGPARDAVPGREVEQEPPNGVGTRRPSPTAARPPAVDAPPSDPHPTTTPDGTGPSGREPAGQDAPRDGAGTADMPGARDSADAPDTPGARDTASARDTANPRDTASARDTAAPREAAGGPRDLAGPPGAGPEPAAPDAVTVSDGSEPAVAAQSPAVPGEAEPDADTGAGQADEPSAAPGAEREGAEPRATREEQDRQVEAHTEQVAAAPPSSATAAPAPPAGAAPAAPGDSVDPRGRPTIEPLAAGTGEPVIGGLGPAGLPRRTPGANGFRPADGATGSGLPQRVPSSRRARPTGPPPGQSATPPSSPGTPPTATGPAPGQTGVGSRPPAETGSAAGAAPAHPAAASPPFGSMSESLFGRHEPGTRGGQLRRPGGFESARTLRNRAESGRSPAAPAPTGFGGPSFGGSDAPEPGTSGRAPSQPEPAPSAPGERPRSGANVPPAGPGAPLAPPAPAAQAGTPAADHGPNGTAQAGPRGRSLSTPASALPQVPISPAPAPNPLVSPGPAPNPLAATDAGGHSLGAAASNSSGGPAGSDGFEAGQTTPIFEEIASAWFRSNRAIPVEWAEKVPGHGPAGGARGADPGKSPTPGALPRRVPGAEGPAAGRPGPGPARPARSWSAADLDAGFATPADEGWRAAEATARRSEDTVTDAGLPKRRPRTRLVPGSAAGSAVLAAPPSGPRRNAEQIRGRLSSYQQGVRQGRESRLRRQASQGGEETNPAHGTTEHDEEKS